MEDAFGNAFAGKYESIFLVNQGEPQHRYAEFEEAVRRVFASTMDENALAYREQRGLDQKDEQMALLVQRVSGSHKNGYFFPEVAGVGISHNTFVWKPELDPKAGMLRLSLPVIASLTPPEWNVRIHDARVNPVDFTEKFDLVGIIQEFK